MNYLAAINAAGDDADERYKIALAAIREKANDVIIEIARQENHCRARDYATRWGLIYAASELVHPAALPFFRSVVLTPIPPEESSEPHSFSTVAEESILRTTAVDGVARLAADGSKEAVDALFDFLHVPSLSVKRAAVQGLMGVRQGESLRGRIEERLCPEDKFLLDIKPIDVRKVTQISDPERDLSDAGRKSNKPITPDLPDRAARTDTRSGDSKTIVQGNDAPKGK
ncbi:MAG: hypothetical protein FJX62_04475 [Alphaproteobacteria bacterium]|nr:hypothetical protein [Alphaproteobacteria bacterium]